MKARFSNERQAELLTFYQLCEERSCGSHGLIAVQLAQALPQPLLGHLHLLRLLTEQVEAGLGLGQFLLETRRDHGQPRVSFTQLLAHRHQLVGLRLLPGDLLPQPAPDLLLHLPEGGAGGVLLLGLGWRGVDLLLPSRRVDPGHWAVEGSAVPGVVLTSVPEQLRYQSPPLYLSHPPGYMVLG